jgi:hypothetical protein
MSVLYKALQKAQKENEERQPAAATPSGATTSAVRMAMPSINWRVAGLGVAVVLAAVIGAAFFLFESAPAPQQQALRPVAPPAATQPAAPPAIQPPPAPTPAAPGAAPEPTAPPAAGAPAAPTQVAAAPAPAAETPAPTTDASPAEAGAPVVLTPPRPAAKPAAAKPAAAPAANQPMPQLAADSPARVLNPPIAIKRDEYDFSGVGDAVQVRRVSQQAQDNVTAGYNALVRGDHDMALGFYERALQQEPRSLFDKPQIIPIPTSADDTHST